MRYIRTIILLLLVSVSAMGQTLKPAGTTADQATRVLDTVALSVQPGGNFIRVAAANLPAVITYMPDTAFGPIPMAIMDEDTLSARMSFHDCAMTWTWEAGRDDRSKIIEIRAHENATILVEPFFCPANTSTVVDDAQESYEWYGTTYTQSGVYTHENTTEYCSWTDTLHLTIHRNLKDTTIYFCPGMHEEGVVEDDGWSIDYRPDQLAKPSPDWYMEGVIRESQADKALLHFRRAEQNLEEHYQPPYVPISNIVWSFRSADDSESHEMEIKDEPQWVEAGTVSLIVRFLCGAPYYSSFTTDVEEVESLSRPVKVMENGTVTIIRGGKRYNVLGSRIQ